MGDNYQTNQVTPLTIFRLEEEGRHQHPTSRGQAVQVALGYQPMGRPVQQAAGGSKDLTLADGQRFSGWLGTTVVDEDVKRNFEARTGGPALNAVFFGQVVTLFTGHGLISVGNGTEVNAARQLLTANITNSLNKFDALRLNAGKWDTAGSAEYQWAEYVEEVETGVFRFNVFDRPFLLP